MRLRERRARHMLAIRLLVGTHVGTAAIALPPMAEPWPPLHGYDATALPARPASPDPLVRYSWSAAATPGLQTFPIGAAAIVSASPREAFHNLQSVLSATPDVVVQGQASLCLDFGLETASWVELSSPDLGTAGHASVSDVTISISEYTAPYDGKSAAPKAFAGGRFRACFDPEPCQRLVLYEGVRYAWLTYVGASNFTLRGFGLRAMARPMAYVGSFASSDALLERIWWTGAYGVRVNAHDASFGSILINRGDRLAFQGDNHIADAVAARVFGAAAFGLIRGNLNSTDSGPVKGHAVHDSNLAPYPLFWAMSVCDYLWASNDTSTFEWYVPDIVGILAEHAATAQTHWLNTTLNFWGWDDRVRVGAGEMGIGGLEAQLAYANLLVHAHRYAARTLRAVGPAHAATAANLSSTADALAARLRSREAKGGGAYWRDYGVHAAAHLVLAGVPTAEELRSIGEAIFNDSVTICSWSPFNTYFILQALARLPDGVRYGAAAARQCWGGMLQASRGCFWELYDPTWADFMQDGDKPPSRPSLCHPWSSGVTTWLTDHLLGVTPLRPGFGRYLAAPGVGPDLPRVSGDVATGAAAPIHINATWSGGEIGRRLAGDRSEMTITIRSDEAAGHVAVPQAVHREGTAHGEEETTRADSYASSLVALSIDGIPSAALSAEAAWEALDGGMLGGCDVLAGRVLTPLLPPGTHVVKATYRHPPPRSHAHPAQSRLPAQTPPPRSSFPPFPPAHYPVAVSNDSATRGDWIGKGGRGSAGYGGAGWVLFGYDGGKTLSRLPAYVANISFPYQDGMEQVVACAGTHGCACAPSDLRCLRDPRDPGRRALGFVSGGTVPGCQGMVLDLALRRGGGRHGGAGGVRPVRPSQAEAGRYEPYEARRYEPYRLAMYFVAEARGRSTEGRAPAHALRVMDLETLNPVAATPYVHSFKGGVWWVLQADRPLRIRIEPIYGGGRLAAVAFD